jgi:hypothetical protein
MKIKINLLRRLKTQKLHYWLFSEHIAALQALSFS